MAEGNNKYDELENLPDAASEASEEPAEKNIAQQIEAAAKVQDASMYLRGQKKVKVIKKSAIKAIVDSIIKTYGGIEHQELISKIAEYEFTISNLKQDKLRLSEQLAQVQGGQQALQEDEVIRYEKQIEELRARLEAAEKILAQEVSKERLAELEEEVLRLRQRVKELEHGLELAVTVEEFDYGLAIEAAMEQTQKITEIDEIVGKALEADPNKRDLQDLKGVLEAMTARLAFFKDLFEAWGPVYSGLLKKVEEKEGSVGVVAELVRLSARNYGLNREMELYGQFLETAEAAVKSR